MTSEGPKLYLRSNNGFKKDENAWLHNASLEGPEQFGLPKNLAPWIHHYRISIDSVLGWNKSSG